MGDRRKPYALVVLDEDDSERGWCVAEFDTEEDLERWMDVVAKCCHSVVHATWGRDCDMRITGATVVMVSKENDHA